MDLTFHPVDGSQHDGLLIPNITPPEISNEVTLCRTSLAEQHAKLYITAKLCNQEDATKKATNDVAAVMKCFPAVTNKDVILAMSSWLTVLCGIDDAVEKLDFDVARLALAHAVDILHNSSPDHPPATYEAIQKGESQETFAVRVLALAAAYCSQLQELLPHDAQLKLRQVSMEALEAMVAENQCRQRGSIDESTYLSIRAKTIGMQPFFLLVQYHFDPMSASCSGNRELQSMMSAIAIATGFQNDLIGLERDMERGEQFNYVLRLSNPSTRERKARVLKAMDLHNDTMHKAIDSWEALQAGSDLSVQACAESLLAFVGRHYLWATTCRRYKCHERHYKPSRLRAGIGQVILRAMTMMETMRTGLRLYVQRPPSQKDNDQGKRRGSLHGMTIRMDLKKSTKASG